MKSLSPFSRLAAFLLVCLLPGLACNLPPVYSAQDYLPPTITAYTGYLEPKPAATLAPTVPQPSPSPFMGVYVTPTGPVSATQAPPTPGVTSAAVTLPAEVPTANISPTLTPAVTPDISEYLVYNAFAGDTLAALALRFDVPSSSIVSDEPLNLTRLITPGQVLLMPNTLPEVPRWGALLPDSEVIYSPSAGQFDLEGYILQAGGFLNSYSETLDGKWLTGPQIVRRVATEASVNPRLLLAFIEYRTRWVTGQLAGGDQLVNPLGFNADGYTGLYKELTLAANHLNIGYYGWRMGTRTSLDFKDRTRMRLTPEQNAGTVALQNLFSKFFTSNAWVDALYGAASLPQMYTHMFGDPWERAAGFDPLFPADLEQPLLELPFQPGQAWALTAGPHIAWTNGTPRGALDFAPLTGDAACNTSRAWAVAAAPGLVIRSENSAVVLDLDGDGNEGTGWVLLYYHVAAQDRVQAGAWLPQDGLIGHPSCEGGRSTGTHLHIARKYNGEWIPAGGALPMVLSGWTAQAGERPYDGSLTRGDQVVTSNVNGARTSVLSR